MSGNDALRRVGDAGTTRCMRSFRRSARIAFALALVALAVAQSGCASFRGARAYQRGSQALDRGDAPVAISEFERAATLVPHASEVQNHLGIAYSMEGRWDPALAAFRRAVELDCDNQAAAQNLAEAEAVYGLPASSQRAEQTPR
jgi:Flp pilus assembly protein TadD